LFQAIAPPRFAKRAGMQIVFRFVKFDSPKVSRDS
jgi:hypothetical protein